MLDGTLANVSVRPLRSISKHRPRSIADKQRPIGSKRQPARHAEVRRHHLIAAIVEDAIDAAFEAARDVEMAIGTQHHRRGIHEPVDEGLARAVRGDLEDRDGGFLAARAAVGHIEIAVGAEHRVVYLMKAGGEERADARVQRGARQPRDFHRRLAAVETRRHDHRHAIRRRKRHPRRHAADGHEVERRLRLGKSVAAKPQPSAFDYANWLETREHRHLVSDAAVARPTPRDISFVIQLEVP